MRLVPHNSSIDEDLLGVIHHWRYFYIVQLNTTLCLKE